VHTVDIIGVCTAVVIAAAFAVILARQRYLLRASGTIPLAIRSRSSRWQYGVARFAGGDLRWYRSLGLATRPSRVLLRSELSVVGSRSPVGSELQSLPASAVIVECRDGRSEVVLGLSVSAYTGFVSWLEASAPMA
jgi:hypothetical protein